MIVELEDSRVRHEMKKRKIDNLDPDLGFENELAV